MKISEKLEYLVGKRFKTIEDIEKELNNNFNGKNSKVSLVDYNEKDNPEDWKTYDLMFNCSLNPDTKSDYYGDFEMFYIITRTKQFYITEINYWS